MNKMIISIAAAFAVCVVDVSGTALRGAGANKDCMCSFLTVASCCEGSDEPEQEADIEYGFKLFEIISGLFG